MTAPVIVDTGPLVALFNRRDQWHRWAVQQFGALAAPLLTCEAVVVEAAHLLRHDAKGPDAIFQLMSRGLLTIDFSVAAQSEPIRKLMWRYRDVPMSVADACLVRMSENVADARVLTLDADFRRYRRHGRQIISLIVPADVGPRARRP